MRFAAQKLHTMPHCDQPLTHSNSLLIPPLPHRQWRLVEPCLALPGLVEQAMGLLSASPSLPSSPSSPPRIVRVDVSTPTAPPSPGTPPQHSDTSRQAIIPLEEDEGALKKALRKGVDDKR